MRPGRNPEVTHRSPPEVSNPTVRCTRLAIAYRRYLNTADTTAFAAEVDGAYSAATLCRLLSLGEVELRRAAALSLGTVGDRWSIEPLGRSLSDPDRGVRMAADDSFRALLSRGGAPRHHQQLLRSMHMIDGDQYAAALPATRLLCDVAPMYAEAHHQLAICFCGLDRPVDAATAYVACLWRCRYHYAAWQGLAKCRLALHDPAGALVAFQRAVEINPDLEAARIAVRRLTRRQSP